MKAAHFHRQALGAGDDDEIERANWMVIFTLGICPIIWLLLCLSSSRDSTRQPARDDVRGRS